MAAHAVSTESSDRMHGAGETVEGTNQTFEQGASEGYPAVEGFIGRMVYTASYGISYGIVFPVMLVASVFPADNALYQGLTDGAMAARERVSAWRDGEAGMGEEEDHEGEESEGKHDGAQGRRRKRTTRHQRGGRKGSH
jgi:hypothetical protein